MFMKVDKYNGYRFEWVKDECGKIKLPLQAVAVKCKIKDSSYIIETPTDENIRSKK